MQTPAPVNLSHLQSILAKSKQVMKKVDTDKPIVTKGVETKGLSESYGQEPTRHAPAVPNYSEQDERDPVYENYVPPTSNIHEAIDYTEEHVMNSKLPPIVKEAMLKNHIAKPKFTASKFSLDDVSGLIEKKPINTQQFKPQQLNETTKATPNAVMIDPSVLKAMIKEAVAEYFKESYEKNITETAIKKTINVLIKEGKITPKKK